MKNIHETYPSFTEVTRLGKNGWRHWLLGILLILFFWFVLGTVASLAIYFIVIVDNNPATNLTPAGVVGASWMIGYVGLNVSFLLFLLGIYLAIRFIHKRPFQSLITPYATIDWARIGLGFGVWFLLVAIISGVEAVVYTGRYQLTFQASEFFIFLLIALVLTTIQATTEELFFRGYLLQGNALWARNFFVLAVINGILFMIPHLGNPEVSANAILLILYYFGFGALFAFITLRDNSSELAIGAHVANNLFTAIFANFKGSALQTPAIFTANTFDVTYSLVGFILTAVVFYVIVTRFPRRQSNNTEVGGPVSESARQQV